MGGFIKDGDGLRYACSFCGKSVTSKLDKDVTIRALAICPECFELMPENVFEDMLKKAKQSTLTNH